MVPPKPNPDPIYETYRREGPRVFATLVRVLGSFELAEDALHNAFVAAAERWPREGMPKNPVAWLVSAGRFKAIDQLRRQRRMTPWSDAAEQIDTLADDGPAPDEREAVKDDRLRLIFICCHPSGLNQLKCGVDPLELDASGICCKAPIRLGLTAIASAQPSLDLPFQSLPVFDASVEALGDQNRQLGFGHVQPASMFGRVVPFETLNQAACLSGGKRFIE